MPELLNVSPEDDFVITEELAQEEVVEIDLSNVVPFGLDQARVVEERHVSDVPGMTWNGTRTNADESESAA